jgi:2-dehydropantoate 2-reductase
MKTVIMGAGAMGGLFGAQLASSGNDVCLVDPWKEHVEAIRSQGLKIESQGIRRVIPLEITTEPIAAGKADLILLFVKAHDTAKALDDALVLEKEDTVFLTLQNGIGNEEVICRQVDPKKVMLGVTNQGAALLGPGSIRHGGWGKTYIGELDGGQTKRAVGIARMFRNAGIETEVSGDIRRLVWEKLLINVGINPLAALTGVNNGELLDHPESLAVMEQLVSEAAAVARRKGISLEGDPMEAVKAVAGATRMNRCSMGQDLDQGRRTEIDVLNGAVVREAEMLGLAVPYNRMMTQLIKFVEKAREKRREEGRYGTKESNTR